MPVVNKIVEQDISQKQFEMKHDCLKDEKEK